MDRVVQFLDFLWSHWNTAALVITWLGIGLAFLRRRESWKKKQFLARVNFSLNYVSGNRLAMRTLLEATASEVWLNEYGVALVLAAAKRALVDQPFLMLEIHKDRDFANRAVLNVLSERFAETYLAASLGRPVVTAPYVFGITCEKYGDIRTLKLRVLVIAQETLLELFGDNKAAALDLPEVVLRARLTTLRTMYDLYLKDKSTEQPVLGLIELGIAT